MGKTKKANKDALEFMVVNRAIDDPYNNDPNAPSKVLLHVPKEDINESVKQRHEKLIQQIPEKARGVYNEDAITNKLKEMGVKLESGDMDQNDLIEKLNSLHKENMVKKVKMDMTKNELIKFEKGSKIVPVEETIDTTDLSKVDINKLDDKKIDEIFKKSKIEAKFVEYNEFGLQKDIDPEVLQYVTKKEFVEGVDIYIPPPNMTYENRFDIDIQPEEMNDDYKEVYEALNKDDEDDAGELEDDFIFLANGGEAPVKIDESKKFEEEVVSTTQPKAKGEPSYKFITKEEKEFLDKKFSSTYDKYYKNNEDVKPTYASKAEFDDAIDELTGNKEEFEEYEDYEFEDEELEDEENSEEGDEPGQYNNNIKIEYMNDKKKHTRGKKVFGDNIKLDEIDKIIHDKNYVEKTIELFENKPEEEDNEEGYPEYYINKKLDITSVTGILGNLPKTIAYDKPYKPKKEKKEEIEEKVIINNKPIDITGEEKNEKKLRKKILKEEKREKRAQKKNLKKAFAVIFF